MGKRYEMGDISEKKFKGGMLEKVSKYMDRHGPQDENTIKLLCGRVRPGESNTPTTFFRNAIKQGWIVPAKDNIK